MNTNFFLHWCFDYVIGYDGLGAFDFASPPFVSNVSDHLANRGNLPVPGLPKADPTIELYPRKGVKPFKFLVGPSGRFVFFDKSLHPVLEPILVDLRDVTIVFSDMEIPMFAANLEVVDLIEHTDFSSSTFELFETSGQTIGFNRIAAGELPPDYESKPEETGLSFSDMFEYREYARKQVLRLRTVRPKKLSVRVDTLPPIVNFGGINFLFRSDLVSTISLLDSPGTFFPGAPVTISKT